MIGDSLYLLIAEVLKYYVCVSGFLIFIAGGVLHKSWKRKVQKKNELLSILAIPNWTRHTVFSPEGVACDNSEILKAHADGTIYEVAELPDRGAYIVKTKTGAVWFETKSRDMATGRPIALPKPLGS